jgi:hypothetical protein
MEIRRVLIRKDGIKYLIVPKHSDINGGDYVSIDKIDKEVLNGRRKKS